MYSNRTKNTECLNNQNVSIIFSLRSLNHETDCLRQILGFHLSDGTVYTYLKGNEYEDIAASWDWNRQYIILISWICLILFLYSDPGHHH